MGGANPTRQQLIADFGRAGMNGQTLRFDAKATGIENKEGSFRWEELDRQIGTIAGTGASIEVLLCVTAGFKPPGWICEGEQPGIPNPGRFADFFAAVMTRYAADPYDVRLFEVYNEPNFQFTELGSNQRARADHYFRMLESVWVKTQALRAQNPAIKLVGGSTAGPPKSARAADVDYFDELWNVKAAYRYMDLYSFHTYIRGADMASGGYVPPEFPFGKPSRGLLWQDILVPSGAIDWHGKPVWLTEMGYDSAHASLGPTEELREANQARWEVRAAITCRGAPGNYIHRFVQFNAYWGGREAYGLRNGTGGPPKPQWHAWKTLNDVFDDTVTSVEMEAYYHVTSPATNHCSFKYTKRNGARGWAAWWVPTGKSGTVVLGAGPVTGDVYTREMSASAWTHLGRYANRPLSVTATNDSVYVEVR